MPAAIVGVMAAQAAFSAYQSHKQGKKQDKALATQQQTANKQSALANTISGYAKDQHSMAQPAMQKALQYYMSLSGSAGQGAMAQALAPEISNINSTYKGAESGMMARMAPGAGRDQALGQLYRQRTGQIGQAGIQGRQRAIGALGDMGMNMQGNANSMWGNATGALGGAAMSHNQIAQQNILRGQQGAQNWKEIGMSMGNVLLPYLMGQQSGGQQPLPSSRINIPGMYGDY